MNEFLHIDLNVFMVAVCLIMYLANRNMNERHMAHNLIFRMLILSNMALLILEAFTWLLEGQATPLQITLYYVVTTILYILTPLPGALWVLYVNWQLFQNARRMKACLIGFGIPFAVSLLLSLATPWTGWMFIIDANGVYQRGAWYPLLALISFVPIVFASGMVILHQKRVSKQIARMMILYMLPPTVATVAQVLFYGITVLWSSITISIFLIHTNIQSNQLHLDHLTGAINRRQLDIILADRIKAAQNKQPLACILLDINHFKAINDTLGHIAGDEALKDASALLQSCIRKRDLLARFGGDEFIIITDIDNEETLREMAQRIRLAVQSFNSDCKRNYTLGFSIGFAAYDPGSDWDKDRYIAYVDSLMYRDKNGDNK
ncbi:MAG: GGDEF domain-containing protein [Clostridiaceae bacterium]